MQFVIDRFEGNYAVCEKEDSTIINIEKSKLPSDAHEGDILLLGEDGSITIDQEASAQKKKQVKKLMDELWK